MSPSTPPFSTVTISWAFRAGMIFVGVAVALGAFGAHGLESRLPQWYPEPELAERRADNWQTAVLYQMVHGLSAAVVGVLASLWPGKSKSLAIAAGCLLAGNAIFSGCLYALVLTDLRVLGAIVPIGGVVQLLGWFIAAFAGPLRSTAGN